ncbi:hypothetical protein PybrP1_005485 [[Pythium] brassicae (nom. inval.)]|nr:hypothetical protein PybrP1_005485 [[Pythium] brassicae (nom. inval.)]
MADTPGQEVPVGDAARRSRRQLRSTLAAHEPPADSAVASPAVAETAAPASPVRAAAPTEPEAPNSATRRRRAQAVGGAVPSASSTGADTAEPASARAQGQARKVLGRYTARECTLLCEAILQQLKANSTAPRVLEDAASPAHIPWAKIAETLRAEHHVALRPRDAQALWRFLAYAETPAASSDEPADELLAASDAEEISQSVSARPAARARAAAATPAAAPDAPPFRLYPSYALPSGLPERWQQQEPVEAVKATLPLTFVAAKFLKPKPGAPPALLAAAGGSNASASGAAGATGSEGVAAPVEEKKKRGRKPGPKPKVLVDGEPSKKPRATPKATPPRTTYTPSPTPPAQPVHPRSAFQFFCRMYELNPRVATAESGPTAPTPSTLSPATATATVTTTATTTATVTTTATTTATAAVAAVSPKKTYSELQALFNGAPLAVRSQCQKFALEDLDRYNRECVRRRIWEKAMASQRSSPAPAPRPVATPATPAAPAKPAGAAAVPSAAASKPATATAPPAAPTPATATPTPTPTATATR